MGYGIVAGLMVIVLLFKIFLLPSIGDNSVDLGMIHRQLGWIAVILLVIACEFCCKMDKVTEILNNNNKLLKNMLDMNTPPETLETTKSNEDEQKSIVTPNNDYKKGKIIISIILVTIILMIIGNSIIRTNNKNSEAKIDNTHTPAAQMYK